MPRPELPPITVGYELIVIERSYRSSIEHRVHVEKVGRAWLDLRAINSGRGWRMRITTQNQDTGYGTGGDRFVTPEQHDWEQRLADAESVIFRAGLTYNSVQSSRWRTDEERVFALAEFLRAYDTEHPTTAKD